MIIKLLIFLRANIRIALVFDTHSGEKQAENPIHWSNVKAVRFFYESSGEGGSKAMEIADKYGHNEFFYLELLKYHGENIAPEAIFSLVAWLVYPAHPHLFPYHCTDFYARNSLGRAKLKFDLSAQGITIYDKNDRHSQRHWQAIGQLKFVEKKGGQVIIIENSGKQYILPLKGLTIHIDDLKGSVAPKVAFEIIERAYQASRISNK